MFRVGNRHHGDKGIYCGRPTVLGNPYEIDSDATRDEVCDRYAVEFPKLRQRPEVQAMLNSLLRYHREKQDVVLVCYCAPKRCHCDTIAGYLNGVLEGKT